MSTVCFPLTVLFPWALINQCLLVWWFILSGFGRNEVNQDKVCSLGVHWSYPQVTTGDRALQRGQVQGNVSDMAAGRSPWCEIAKGQQLVFPAASFSGDVSSAQHKIQPQSQQDLLYHLTGLEPSCSDGNSVDADVSTWAMLNTFIKEGAGMTSDLGWETAGQTHLAETWGPWGMAQRCDSDSATEQVVH